MPPYYDSLIAKLIVHDQNRERCIARLERSLAEFVIDGIPSSIPLLRAILAEPDFRASRFDTELARALPRGTCGQLSHGCAVLSPAPASSLLTGLLACCPIASCSC